MPNNPGNNNNNAPNPQQNSQNRPKLPPTDGSYLGCWRCCELKHYHQSCPFINSKCKKCNIFGHTEARCIKHKIALTNLTKSADIRFAKHATSITETVTIQQL